MRRDAALLDDIAASAAKINEFCVGIELIALMKDEVRQAAILHHLAVIGEAASRVSPQLREHHAEVRWPLIVSLRRYAIAWSTSTSALTGS